jgi:hypothetical protein
MRNTPIDYDIVSRKIKESNLKNIGNATIREVKKLVDILNPYMHGVVDKIIINHVIIADNMDKVEEFNIEHTPSKEAQAGKAQEGKSGQNAGKAQKAGG